MILRNKTFPLLLLVTASVLLSGCYTDFEPNLESTPVVCVNSDIIAGDSIKVEVTRTWRYSEGSDYELDLTLHNADVSLYVNGDFKEKLDIRQDGFSGVIDYLNPPKFYYRANYIPKEGDVIMLKVHDETYGDADAEVTIPYAVDIENVKTQIISRSNTIDEDNETFSSYFELLLKVNFTDPASITNYYMFKLGRYNPGGYYDENHVWQDPLPEYTSLDADYSYEPLFSEHITPLETVVSDGYGLYTVFSDRQISGRNYSLQVPVEGYYYWNNKEHTDLGHRSEIIVRLNHISPSYYNFMLSLWAATEGVSGALGDVGLGDPVWEFSNVSTGAGIVSASAATEVRLNVYELLTKEN